MCTRILWSDNQVATVVSRTMDWSVSDEPDLWSLPAGISRSSDAGPTSLSWTSRYPSVTLSMWHSGTVDGMNNQGLAAHALYLDDVDWEAPDDRPAVTNTMWVQYLLDNFATVAEVVAAVPPVRIASLPIRGHDMGCHVAVDDASGDSAIIEPIDGKLVVHHRREFAVMANSPDYDEQLANLARYRPFGGELPPPGDITSLDRFVRASYYLHYLPKPATLQEAMAGVFKLAANVAVPPGSPYQDGGVYPTWWTAGADLTNLTYYFLGSDSPNMTWVDLGDVAGTQVISLNPREVGLSGDIAARFSPSTLPF
jgi:penicillin V acylase-like amidase (Ntn superfamily)